MGWRFKSLKALLLLGGACFSLTGQAEQPANQELVKYINEARRRGVAEAKIKREAITVGWPAAIVEETLAAMKGGKIAVRAGNEAVPPKETTAPQLAVEVEPSPNPAPIAGGVARATTDDYRIGAGDTLQISVWKEPDVSVPSVVVRSDGRITIPLIKEVTVGGLTPSQAEAMITEGLRKYITDPNVTVVMAAMNSKKVYVIGAVRKEGPLPYNYGMTVMQALSEAGGLTDYAKRKKVYILRSENGREYRLDFNYEEVVRGERMEQNIVLLAGDTVVIPN